MCVAPLTINRESDTINSIQPIRPSIPFCVVCGSIYILLAHSFFSFPFLFSFLSFFFLQIGKKAADGATHNVPALLGRNLSPTINTQKPPLRKWREGGQRAEKGFPRQDCSTQGLNTNLKHGSNVQALVREETGQLASKGPICYVEGPASGRLSREQSLFPDRLAARKTLGQIEW